MDIFKKAAYKLGKSPKGAITVIIAAGGSGERMGGVSKPLISLCGRPAIEYSLDAFSACDEVVSIYISAKGGDLTTYYEYIASGKYPKLKGIVKGGSTRGESVENAFLEVFSKEKTDFVAIHDGARPLITPEEIRRAATTAAKYGSGVCASMATDTVKRASFGRCVKESVDREGLWLLSTPQIFDTDIFHTALSAAKRDGFSATDDSSLLEHAGFTVMLSEASRNNIKLTYPEDIVVAEAILALREGKGGADK